MGPVRMPPAPRSTTPTPFVREQALAAQKPIASLQQLAARQTAQILGAHAGGHAFGALDAFELPSCVRYAVDASFTAQEFRTALTASALGKSLSPSQYAWRSGLAVGHIRGDESLDLRKRYTSLIDLRKLVVRAGIHAIMQANRRPNSAGQNPAHEVEAMVRDVERFLAHEMQQAFSGACDAAAKPAV